EAEEKESRRQDAEQRAEEQRKTEAERKHRKAELQTTAEPPQPIHKLSIPVFNVIGHREEKAKKHDLSFPRVKAGERKIVAINGVEFAFRWCSAGTFTIGSPTWEDGRYLNETPHKVTLTKGFWMMETEVTQKQWKVVMGNNPSHFKDDNLPVEQVSWYDCQEFCKKCSQLGLSVQLPTEAQWEYACRAGSTTAYFWGNALNGDKANCDGRYPCGTTTKGKNLQKTTPVGSYEANAWGLYDMHGNVWEWCQDWYRDYLGKSVTDPVGPSSGSNRVIRGGCWFSGAQGCRSAFRSGINPGYRYYYLGFRLSISIISQEN
ncbi:MAG: SUMF1/EgtB/PvdO family nonheme iron enzyme, partial [Thermoguttaceae bacterium]|nr:SUMF1/EgtB/PvdO family nonheme iron enzyme [Thermoguttaceae bacterium]